MTTTAQLIRRARIARGWTQTVLAANLGMTQSYVSRLESGIYEPSIIALRRIAGALGVQARDLLGDESC